MKRANVKIFWYLKELHDISILFIQVIIVFLNIIFSSLTQWLIDSLCVCVCVCDNFYSSFYNLEINYDMNYDSQNTWLIV